jgi:hypothetical protein
VQDQAQDDHASSPVDQIAFLFVFGTVDLAAGKAPIKNVNCCGAPSADGRVDRVSWPSFLSLYPQAWRSMWSLFRSFWFGLLS